MVGIDVSVDAVAEDPDRIACYWFKDQAEACVAGLELQIKFAKAFHSMLIASDSGWVEIVKLTGNLVALKGPDGQYDLAWRKGTAI